MTSPPRQWVWLAALVVVVLAPVLLYGYAGHREHTSLAGRVVTITGVQAAGLMAYTIAVGTRMKAGGFGAHIHRLCGEAALGAAALHVLFVLQLQPDNAWLMVLPDSTPPGAAGTASILALAAAATLGVQRKRAKLKATGWRLAHVTAAWLAALFALAHILWLGNLAALPAWLAYLAATAAAPALLWATRPKGVPHGRADARR